MQRSTRNGEVRVSLDADWYAAPTSSELFALIVARQALRGLRGVAAQHWVASWGGDAEVLEPAALRERLRTELARMQARLPP